jgi:methylglutaconyl-CoA hydratase
VAALATEHDGRLLRLTLERPEKRNALDRELLAALTEQFAAAGEARAVVLRGAGPTFSAGADIAEMRAALEQPAGERLADARAWQALLAAVDGCPAPVVAGVQGDCLGGACGLVACCDVVVADRGARFGFSEVKLGIVPAVVSPYVVARIGAGPSRALFVTGERFAAERALRLGLVSEVVDDLAAGVERVLEEILSGGPDAVRIAKQIAREPPAASDAARLIAGLRASEEGEEGLRAFLERRPPLWRG